LFLEFVLAKIAIIFLMATLPATHAGQRGEKLEDCVQRQQLIIAHLTQAAGNRESGTGNREQGIGNLEQAASLTNSRRCIFENLQIIRLDTTIDRSIFVVRLVSLHFTSLA